MGVIGIVLSNIRRMKQAKKLRNMPRAELMVMDDEDFYDAVSCVTEDAVYDFAEQKGLAQELIFAYTLTKFEMEVNNGGLCQFFVNSSRETAPYVSDALEAVGAAGIKALFDGFIKDNGIDVNDLSSFKLSRVEDYEAQTERFDFDSFDDRFYEDCDLHLRIIAYARKNVEKIFA